MRRRPSTFHLYDRLLHGQLGPMLLAWRNEEPPISYMEIVVRLRSFGIDVSTETVRRWMPLVEEQAKAAS